MNLTTLVPRLYGWLLRLYPETFRDLFADEMQIIFAEVWVTAQTKQTIVATLFHEFATLLVGAAREHVIALNRSGPRDQARAVIRAASLLFLLFYTRVTLDSGDPERMRFMVFNVLLGVGVITAWHWERRGGVLTIASALTVMVLMAVNESSLLAWFALIPALLYPLPFVLFGWMFAILGGDTLHVPNRSQTQ